MIDFCTLFDSNYLDKGLVLYQSLRSCCEQFHLYILPMDEVCARILVDLQLDNVVVIGFDDFLTPELALARSQRGKGEFCWTCTPFLVDYCLIKYNLDKVTYIDSDLFFYNNPECLIEEMLSEGDEVQIIRHNFIKREKKAMSVVSGEYCVQFNTFLNTKSAKEVLESWKCDCLEDCSFSKDGGSLGDQMYLNKWPLKYDCVNISKNLGAGVAPWNSKRFAIIDSDNTKYVVKDYESKQVWPLVFFHFQNIVQTDNSSFDTNCYVRKSQKNVFYTIYRDYITALLAQRNMLKEQFGLEIVVKAHPVLGAKTCSSESIIKKIKNIIYYVRSFEFMFEKLVIKEFKLDE